MGKIFQYFGLATAVIESISGIQSALKISPVSGPALQTAIEPALDSVTGLLAHITIPAQLVADICAAAADSINAFFHKAAA